jgi:hypothetical protein
VPSRRAWRWGWSYPIEVEVTHKGDLRQRALHAEALFKEGRRIYREAEIRAERNKRKGKV